MQNNKIIGIRLKDLFKGEERDITMKKTSGGAKKHGRNKEKCQKYQGQNRREKNKIGKWKKLIKNLSPDNKMRKQLEKRIKEVEG
jgi:hypothetical protein